MKFLATFGFVVSSIVFLSSVSLGDKSTKSSDKPYIVIVGPQELNTVRVNVENYEPKGKDFKKVEVDFGDGSPKVVNKLDLYHSYAQNRNYTLTVKTWDSRNNLIQTHSETIKINTQFAVRDLPNTTILGPLSIKDEKKYSLNLNSLQAAKLYKVTVQRNTNLEIEEPNRGHHEHQNNRHEYNWSKKCKKDFNVEINNIDIFKDREISCNTNEIEKFVLLNTSNIVRFEADEPRWKNTFKIKISAVELIDLPTDTTAPTLSSNISSNTLTRSSLAHISVADLSNTTTYVWDSSNNLLLTESSKEFDLPLMEGLNNYKIQSVDAFNNQSTVLYLSNINKDTTPALLSYQLNSEYIFSSYPQSIQLLVESNEDLQALYVNGHPTTLITPRLFSYLIQVPSPQTFNLQLSGFDIAGNETSISSNIIFSIDNLPPNVNINLVDNSTINYNKIPVTVTDNTAVSTQVFINSNLKVDTTENEFYIKLDQGINVIQIISKDIYGNTTTVNYSNVIFDNVGPTLILSTNENLFFNSLPQNIQVTLESNEKLSYLSYSLNSSTPQDVIPSDSLSQALQVAVQSAGQQTLSVIARDQVGNESQTSYQFIVKIDDQKPVITLGSHPDLTKEESLNIPIIVTDNSETLTDIYVNEILVKENLTSKNIDFAASLYNEGANIIKIVSRDAAGNEADPVKFTITKDTTAPILAQFLPADQQVINSLTVQTSGQANELLSRVLVNGESATLSEDKLNFSKELTFTEYGQKTIEIQYFDLADNSSTLTLLVNLVDSSAPVITTNFKNGFINYKYLNVQVTGGYNNSYQ